MLNYEQRLDRLDTMIVEERVIRHKWTDVDEDGRELVCLLAALSPEAGEREDASACPADVMPAWLAHMTPAMDDCVSDEYRPAMLRRYAALAHRWHVLDDTAWRRAEYRARALCVREAMLHTDAERVLDCCRVVLALCERAAAGDDPSEDERLAAARAAAWEAAMAATEVAEAAGWAASGSPSATAMAADAAAAAADAAAADAAAAAASAADAAAWDRITAATLDVIEAAIEARSAGEGGQA